MQTVKQNKDEQRALRGALGRFPTGVAIATASSAGHQLVGMTINSLTSISLSPALIAWSIDREAASYDAFTAAKRFAVTVLAADQAELAMRFATRGVDKFRGLDIDRHGAPVIPNACAWFSCETYRLVPLGDHTMLVGRIIEYGTSASPPLVFLAGQFTHLAQPVARAAA